MAKFEGNDRIEEIVSRAASDLADEVCLQNGLTQEIEDHDDFWYDLKDVLRDVILSSCSEWIDGLEIC